MVQIRAAPAEREYIYSAWERRGENFFCDCESMAGLSSENLSAKISPAGSIRGEEVLMNPCASIEAQVRLYRGIHRKGRIFRIARSASMEAYDRG